MASKRTDPRDPYAPPPMYHDRSGRVVRIGLIAVLLAALGVGYFAWSAGNTQQTAALAPPAQEQHAQQLADAGYYRPQPTPMPQAQPVAPTPQTAAPAPTRHSTPTRSSRTYSAPAESAPPPVNAAPTSPAPPATTTPQMPDTTPPGQG